MVNREYWDFSHHHFLLAVLMVTIKAWKGVCKMFIVLVPPYLCLERSFLLTVIFPALSPSAMQIFADAFSDSTHPLLLSLMPRIQWQNIYEMPLLHLSSNPTITVFILIPWSPSLLQWNPRSCNWWCTSSVAFPLSSSSPVARIKWRGEWGKLLCASPGEKGMV